jgi:hypothetical protein
MPKSMVALGMFPKDEDFHKLEHIMETLEAQNAYLLSMVTWIVHRHGNSFHPPTVNQPWVESFVATAHRDVSVPSPFRVPHDQN